MLWTVVYVAFVLRCYATSMLFVWSSHLRFPAVFITQNNTNELPFCEVKVVRISGEILKIGSLLFIMLFILVMLVSTDNVLYQLLFISLS